MSTKAKRLFPKPKPDDVTGTTKKRRRMTTAEASAQLDEHVNQIPCMFCDIRYFESNVAWFNAV